VRPFSPKELRMPAKIDRAVVAEIHGDLHR
jgi:hypothetical protein